MKKQIDPKGVWSAFKNFNNACAVLEEESRRARQPELAIPYIVLGAFTVELGFKCLHSVISGEIDTDWSHSIWKLFSALPDDEREAIKPAFEARVGATPKKAAIEQIVAIEKLAGRTVAPFEPPADGLETVLIEMSEVFVRYRYIYEGLPKEGSIGAAALADILRERIQKRRPDLV